MNKPTNLKKYNAALDFHKKVRAGKLEVAPTKPLVNAKDLSLAYSPGVAAPCLEIFKSPDKAYSYTAKGNIVAVISNGSAVLGLGNLGALASKPVMEGKAVLFKRFADIDGIDLEIDTLNTKKFVDSVSIMSKSWGGINLEDIKAPECFIIEKTLSKKIDIPVFHDDQHGTAIIVVAAIINSINLTNKNIKNIKIIINGAGAAGLACAELLKSIKVPKKNIILCDSKGIITNERKDLNPWKKKFAINSSSKTLLSAFKNADIAIGLSVKGAFTNKMISIMAAEPTILALSNPDPEILPEKLLNIRPDAIIATGRSDYPNQVNNVLGFPYIFRGALDVRARKINMKMKIAAAIALAKLARKKVPKSVLKAYDIKKLSYSKEYIIPKPFDPRLIKDISYAVAKAATDSGIAKNPIKDGTKYKKELSDRLRQTMRLVLRRSKRNRVKIK